MEFDNVENEWPVFFLNMIIDGVFKDLPDQVAMYSKLVEKIMAYDLQTGDPLIPQMYCVKSEEMKQEKEKPKSQRRKITNCQNNTPTEVFLWGQAMFIISELLTHNLVYTYELDPIKRYLPCYARPKPVGRYSSFSFLGRDSQSKIV